MEQMGGRRLTHTCSSLMQVCIVPRDWISRDLEAVYPFHARPGWQRMVKDEGIGFSPDYVQDQQ